MTNVAANVKAQIEKNRALKGKYIVRDPNFGFCFIIYSHGGTSWGNQPAEDSVKHETYQDAVDFLKTIHPDWLNGKEICKIDSIGRVRKTNK